MIVTVQTLLRRRLAVPALALLFCTALVAMPRLAYAGAQPPAADATPAAGGEASLVLPDLSTAVDSLCTVRCTVRRPLSWAGP